MLATETAIVITSIPKETKIGNFMINGADLILFSKIKNPVGKYIINCTNIDKKAFVIERNSILKFNFIAL
jgi:DNA-directed RNA polymerase beta subunit